MYNGVSQEIVKPKHAMEIVNKRPGRRWLFRASLGLYTFHILTSPTARIYQRAMDDTQKHELSKAKTRFSLGANTLVQAILMCFASHCWSKKTLFLMFFCPWYAFLIVLYGRTCSKSHPRNLLLSLAFEEQKSFHSAMSFLGGAGCDAYVTNLTKCNENQHIRKYLQGCK